MKNEKRKWELMEDEEGYYIKVPYYGWKEISFEEYCDYCDNKKEEE